MSKTKASLGLLTLAVAAAWSWSASAQQSFPASSAGATLGAANLITHFLPVDGEPTMLTIVDPHQRVIGVYQINRETGEIHLKSVRNFTADLQLDNWNSKGLSPQEIRQGLGNQP